MLKLKQKQKNHFITKIQILQKFLANNENIGNNSITDNSNNLESQNTVSNELLINSNNQIVNNDSKDLATYKSNTSEDSSFDSTLETTEEKQAIEFVENLPINIPIVQDFEEVPSSTVNGQVFDSKSEPKSYQVLAIADDNIQISQNKYENETNNKIVEINKKILIKLNLSQLKMKSQNFKNQMQLMKKRKQKQIRNY